MTDFMFTPKQNELYNSIVTFAKKELNNSVIERDKKQIFPTKEWKKCGALKLQGLCISKKYGGVGLDAVSTAIALEALGYASLDGGLNFSIAAHLLANVVPIALYGSEEQKQNYLPKLCNGTLIASNAITETQSGSDVFSMHTSAVKNKKYYVISGEKTFITNAPVSDITLLYAATNPEKGFHGGISAFILENKTKGITRSAPFDKMGLRTCLMGKIKLKNVLVSEKNLIGREGAGAVIFSESMNWERALIGALHVGTMQQILEMCINYANTRKINNHSIGKHQSVAHRIAEMSIKVAAVRLMVYKAASEIDNKSKKVALIASSAKVFTSESINDICQSALSIFGASGYLTDNHIERFTRDAAAAKIYSGTNDIQKNIIAGWLGL